MNKGNVADFAVIGLVFFIVLSMATIAIYIFSSAQGLGLGATWDGIMATLENSFVMLGLGLFFFLFIGMIAAAYMATQISSSPGLIVIGILVLLPIVFLAGGLGMAWTSIASGDLSVAAAAIPYANDIMDNFVLIVLFGSVLLLISLYAGYRVHSGAG